jgi:hypothetical protein
MIRELITLKCIFYNLHQVVLSLATQLAGTVHVHSANLARRIVRTNYMCILQGRSIEKT